MYPEKYFFKKNSQTPLRTERPLLVTQTLVTLHICFCLM